jgi:putative ferrous iron transport protein C
MLLSEIAAYLKRKRRVSLAELSVTFGLASDVIEPMVAHFIRKGWVGCHHGEVCHGCTMACSQCEVQLWYEWHDAAGLAATD